MQVGPEKISIYVARQKPNNQQVLEKYALPYRKGMSALDALDDIRRMHDPSLAYSHSCRHGKACRQCLAEINGKVAYLCDTLAVEGMIIKPVADREVVRDLIIRN